MEKDSTQREGKRKFALWAKHSTLDEVKKIYKDDNCASQSEFIEKAIRFYSGYLKSQSSKEYLSNVIISSVNGAIAESDEKHSRMMFKMAVELAMIMNLMAANQDVSSLELERLRGTCVKEVARLNGRFTFQDAVDWQRG